MSRPRQRRETEVFSLSFLDCICCGFGAIILIFILSVAQKRTIDRISVDDLQDRLRRLELQVSASKQEVERLTKLLTAAQSELPTLQKKTNESQLKLTDRKRELLALLGVPKLRGLVGLEPSCDLQCRHEMSNTRPGAPSESTKGRTASASPVSASWARSESSGRSSRTTSTLSNWCCRMSPRVSLP